MIGHTSIILSSNVFGGYLNNTSPLIFSILYVRVIFIYILTIYLIPLMKFFIHFFNTYQCEIMHLIFENHFQKPTNYYVWNYVEKKLIIRIPK